jgi:hypothetical protein
MNGGRFEHLDVNDIELQNVVRKDVLENGGPEWVEEPEHGLIAVGPNRA